MIYSLCRESDKLKGTQCINQSGRELHSWDIYILEKSGSNYMSNNTFLNTISKDCIKKFT